SVLCQRMCYLSRQVFYVPLTLIRTSSYAASYTFSLHDALPIWRSASRPLAPSRRPPRGPICAARWSPPPRSTASITWPRRWARRSEEHTSELQSRFELVCRLLLDKKTVSKQMNQLDIARYGIAE